MKNGDAEGVERGGDHGGADGDVVIAKHGELLRAGEGGEDLCAAVGGVALDEEVERAARDEVSGEQNGVWPEGVDAADDLLEEEGFGELFEVEVAELDDAVADEGGGEMLDGDAAGEGTDLMAGDETAVEGKACGCGTRAYKEGAAGEAACAGWIRSHSFYDTGWLQEAAAARRRTLGYPFARMRGDEL